MKFAPTYLGEGAVIAWLGSTREKNRVRARADNFVFFIFYCLSRYLYASFGIPLPKRKKKVARPNPGARGNPNDCFSFSVAQVGRPPKMTEN